MFRGIVGERGISLLIESRVIILKWFNCHLGAIYRDVHLNNILCQIIARKKIQFGSKQLKL